MGTLKKKQPVFGVLAEFSNAGELLRCIERARDFGYTKMEAYTPLPLHEVAHALGHKSRLPLIVLIGGLLGGTIGFSMQYWMSVVDYPQNIGGRPLNSWPSFIVVTFEMTILFAALSAVFGMLALNGLPRPHHPVFDVKGFELASRNRFFLHILSRDSEFELSKVKQFLETQAPLSISEVPH